MYICKIFTCELGKGDYLRRIGDENDQDEIIVEKQNYVIENHRAAKLELAILVLLTTSIEVLQRILDIPYFAKPSAYFGDCDGLQELRNITKPIIYYSAFKKGV